MNKILLMFIVVWSSALQVKPTQDSTDDVRLMGGTSRCTGRLEMKHQETGEWRPVHDDYWNLKSSAVVCQQMACGSAVSTERSSDSPNLRVWQITSSCVGSESSLRECGTNSLDESISSVILKVICSESVRLVNGTSLCSGRVEVKSNKSWVSVCEGNFDQQDAEVVCRELGCGAPSVLQGALYGEVRAPMWTEEFQCKGSESVLLDCGTSGSTRITSSCDKAVGLTCSEPDDVRLAGGSSNCTGKLEMKNQGEWRPVDGSSDWNLKSSSVVCRQLLCGPAVSTDRSSCSTDQPVWWITSTCIGYESSLRQCVTKESYTSSRQQEVICSEPDDVRLAGGSSNCTGKLEMKNQGEWRPVDGSSDWNLKSSSVVCRQLLCGPAVSTDRSSGSTDQPVWWITSTCIGYESSLRQCVTKESYTSSRQQEVICSDLFKPNITIFPSMNGVSEGQQQGLQLLEGSTFTITCSIEPQYPGGSFQLTYTGSKTTHNQTQPAVNHYANFQFPAADHTHQGNYRCVYHINVFKRNLSSESKLLSLTITANNLTAAEIIRITLILLVPLILLISIIIVYRLWKARVQSAGVEDIEMVYYNLPVRKR